MKEDNSKSEELADIRRRAEKMSKGKTTDIKKLTFENIQSLIHELEVHQIELEMQNDELRRAQTVLEIARNRYSDLYDFSPVGYFTFDNNGLILEVNLTGAKKLGRERVNLINKPFSLYIHENKNTFYLHLQKVFNNKIQTTCEIKLLDMKGDKLHVLLESMPICDSDGNILARTSMSDITDRRNAETTMRLHWEIMKNMSEGICLTSLSDGKIIYANPKFEKMFGYNPGEMIGKDITMVNAPTEKNPEEISKEIIEVMNRTGEWHGEINNIQKDGTLLWCYASYSIFDHHEYGKVVLTIYTDITNLKQKDRDLQQTLKALKVSNDELRQFAYIASHDLQEPLRMISSYLQLIDRRYKGKFDKDADEFIAFAVEGANRLQEMIIGLLNYSRIGTKVKSFEKVNFSDILTKTLLNIKIAIDESCAIITNDPLPIIYADKDQFIQVFQNLISNSIKFKSAESPKIHISAKQISEISTPTTWLFSVKDNGIGIDPRYHAKLFNIFQRLHNSEYPGVGIGLSVCKRIVERHGGHIWLDSDIGKGSIFYFTIPINNIKHE